MSARKIAALSLLLLASIIDTASAQFITPYSEFRNLLPLAFAAILASMSIVAIYYMFGSVMNNRQAKARAVGELGQVVGTGIIIMLVIGILTFFGSGVFEQTPSISPPAMQTVCNQLKSTSSQSFVGFLQSDGSFGGSPSPTNVICGEINKLVPGGGGGSVEDHIDYGVFVAYTLIANLTNQAVNNLDALYLFEGWMGFASKFQSVTQICEFSAPSCWSPIGPRDFNIQFSYAPYAGMGSLHSVTQPVEVQATLTFYTFFAQLVLAIFTLYLWPWVLAIGIILRANAFTRRVGGLLIGLSLTLLLIFPSIYAIEYDAFQNPSLAPIGSGCTIAQLQGGTCTGVGILPTEPLFEKPESANPPNPNLVGVYGARGSGYAPSYLVADTPCSTGFTKENVCGYSETHTSPSYDPATCEDAPLTGPACLCGTQSLTYAPCDSAMIQNLIATSPEQVFVVPQPINPNFFVVPNAGRVLNFYSCLPDNLVLDELAFALPYLVPGFGVAGVAFGGLASDLPATPSSIGTALGCTPKNAISSALALTNLYGMVTVSAYLVPLLNLVIVFSSAVGLSALMGGDTDILGLGKLL